MPTAAPLTGTDLGSCGSKSPRRLQSRTDSECVGRQRRSCLLPFVEPYLRPKPQHKKLRPQGPWGKRLSRLYLATGWNQAQRTREFQCDKEQLIRIWNGGLPKVEFVRKLRRLEEIHSLALAGVDSGMIKYVKGKRIDKRPVESPVESSPGPSPQRPDDPPELGKVGALVPVCPLVPGGSVPAVPGRRVDATRSRFGLEDDSS